MNSSFAQFTPTQLEIKLLHCFESSHKEERMNAVREELVKVYRHGIPDLINSVLKDEETLKKIANLSYIQGNGFHKIVLILNEKFSLRFHIYFKDSVAQENIHDHKWDFASVITTGKLVSEIWETTGDPEAAFYKEYVYLDKNKSSLYSQDTKLKLVETVTHMPGDSYILDSNVLHRIRTSNEVTTSTLMCRTETVRESGRLFLGENVLEPDIKPIFFTPNQLRDTFQKYLALYES